MSFFLDKMKGAVDDIKDKLDGAKSDDHREQGQAGEESEHKHHFLHTHSHISSSRVCSDGDNHHLHRFQSFAPQRAGNEAKWYVDACGYMYAVSVALEQAQRSIMILDWWLSPELYLRRPPAKNEQYRLDRLLFQAANRGVQVNIVVYKEVTQALTLSSSHTKHWLEDNDKTGNIRVLRHPDHLPDRHVLASEIWSGIKNSGLSAANLKDLPGDFIKGIYGMSEDTILYWAHHEKLCLVDGRIGFMGGLDLCYGRWDTNQHSIADAHPCDLNEIVFPGQDYNNARIMDFQNVSDWQANKLDRRYNSRMGWSDVSISLRGPVVEDMKAHFVQRWNFLYFEKYAAKTRADRRYHPIDLRPNRAGIIGHPYEQTEDGGVRGEGQYHHFRERMHHQFERARAILDGGREDLREHMYSYRQLPDEQYSCGPLDGIQIQLMRSCSKWSHGVPLEHSIADAYIQTIRDSQHFIYVENQFFITATSKEQKPVQNRIGAAIVERIIRAARNGEPWHMIVNIPAVPGFAGDLRADGSLGTREIMELQYRSINRGGHSIMEKVAQAGFDPMEYIRFYNLRNYDRINSSKAMQQVEQQSGVSYDDARRGHDQKFAHALDSQEYGAEYPDQRSRMDAFHQYQLAAHGLRGTSEMASGRWDSVADCYMLNGPDIRRVPWDGDPQSEMDAFVSEELYIHSKLLIADDRKVICGSANLNDRSQLGSHDSEIAVLIEDQEEIDSYMAGRPWKAKKFAASLRRQLFRKHIGLLPAQDMQCPDANFMPVGHDPNVYDWGSREDHAVADPLAPSFMNLWKATAANNTDAFRAVFHPVPDDGVKNWKQYDAYFERFFKPEEAEKSSKVDAGRPSTWKAGHVVAESFPPGEEGLRQVKDVLSTIKGNLVEMPLLFLKEENIAKEGLSLNPWTEEVYT